MQVYFRIHGYLNPVSGSLYKELTCLLSGMDCDLNEQEMHFHHEGDYIDEHEIMTDLLEILPPKMTGIIDCIDMQEWKMQRYYLIKNSWKKKKIHLNEVLDKKNYEQSG